MKRRILLAFVLGLLITGIPLVYINYMLRNRLSSLEAETALKDQEIAGLRGFGLDLSYVVTKTTPPEYLEVRVAPGNVSAKIGEQILIKVYMLSMVNTPLDVNSVDLVIFDLYGSIVRKQPMILYSHWFANTTYSVVGDETYYKLFISFEINPRMPEHHSEYTATAFYIMTN